MGQVWQILHKAQNLILPEILQKVHAVEYLIICKFCWFLIKKQYFKQNRVFFSIAIQSTLLAKPNDIQSIALEGYNLLEHQMLTMFRMSLMTAICLVKYSSSSLVKALQAQMCKFLSYENTPSYFGGREGHYWILV